MTFFSGLPFQDLSGEIARPQTDNGRQVNYYQRFNSMNRREPHSLISSRQDTLTPKRVSFCVPEDEGERTLFETSTPQTCRPSSYWQSPIASTSSQSLRSEDLRYFESRPCIQDPWAHPSYTSTVPPSYYDSFNEISSQTRARATHKEVTPPIFDGKPDNLDSFLLSFEKVARINGWDSLTMADRVYLAAPDMVQKHIQTMPMTHQLNYDSIRGLLKSRFGTLFC